MREKNYEEEGAGQGQGGCSQSTKVLVSKTSALNQFMPVEEFDDNLEENKEIAMITGKSSPVDQVHRYSENPLMVFSD